MFQSLPSVAIFGFGDLVYRCFGEPVFCHAKSINSGLATTRFSETSTNFSPRSGVIKQERKFQASVAK